MIFVSKYQIGQVIEFSSQQKTRCGEITGVLFINSIEPLYEISDEFLEESRITAILTRNPVPKPESSNGQLELPEVANV